MHVWPFPNCRSFLTPWTFSNQLLKGDFVFHVRKLCRRRGSEHLISERALDEQISTKRCRNQAELVKDHAQMTLIWPVKPVFVAFKTGTPVIQPKHECSAKAFRWSASPSLLGADVENKFSQVPLLVLKWVYWILNRCRNQDCFSGSQWRKEDGLRCKSCIRAAKNPPKLIDPRLSTVLSFKGVGKWSAVILH